MRMKFLLAAIAYAVILSSQVFAMGKAPAAQRLTDQNYEGIAEGKDQAKAAALSKCNQALLKLPADQKLFEDEVPNGKTKHVDYKTCDGYFNGFDIYRFQAECQFLSCAQVANQEDCFATVMAVPLEKVGSEWIDAGNSCPL